MTTLWFCLLAAMLVVYVVLDGFDIGAGLLHLWLGRNETERAALLHSIGPFHEGNEVWLLAAGGTLFFAFPALYAASLSGFYLALMMLLWVLILRGISIEFRNHVGGPVWTALWDAVFCVSSALLALFFGLALGNVIRGVPLDATGFFFEPLWTDFRVGTNTGLLDWYTIAAGLAAFVALAQHGALWAAWQGERAVVGREVAERALRFASRAWWLVAASTAVITAASFQVQPRIAENFRNRPWGWVFPVLALAGLAGVRWWLRTARARRPSRAFTSSCVYLLGMLASAAFGIYPMVLPARGNPEYSLTIASAQGAAYGLKIALIWWTLGVALAVSYAVFVFRHFSSRSAASHDAEHAAR